MYVRVCVCMYVRVCVCTHLYVCMYVYAYMYVCVSVCTYVTIGVCIYSVIHSKHKPNLSIFCYQLSLSFLESDTLMSLIMSPTIIIVNPTSKTLDGKL